MKLANFVCEENCPDFIVYLERILFSTIKSANCLDIGHDADCLWTEMNIYFSYSFWPNSKLQRKFRYGLVCRSALKSV